MIVIGIILRIVAVLLILYALPRVFTGMTGVTPRSDIVFGIVSVLVAVAVFKLGTRLKERSSET